MKLGLRSSNAIILMGLMSLSSIDGFYGGHVVDQNNEISILWE